MLTVIKRILSGLFGRKQSEPPKPPPDPYAYRSVPRKTGPYDRSGAVAVLEPGDDDDSRDSERGKIGQYT